MTLVINSQSEWRNFAVNLLLHSGLPINRIRDSCSFRNLTIFFNTGFSRLLDTTEGKDKKQSPVEH